MMEYCMRAICIKAIVLLLTQHGCEAQSATICENGWLYVEGKCWLYSNQHTTWQQAQQNCQRQNARLASIHNEAENRFLHSAIMKFGVNQRNAPRGGFVRRKDQPLTWDKAITRTPRMTTNYKFASLIAKNPRFVNRQVLAQTDPDTSCFDKFDNFALFGYSDGAMAAATVEDCFFECLNAKENLGFTCLSVNYYHATDTLQGECILNTETRQTKPDTFFENSDPLTDVDYYDNDCDGVKPVVVTPSEGIELCFELVRGQILSGVVQDVVDGLTRPECLQYCVDTTAFDCLSVMFYEEGILGFAQTTCILNEHTRDSLPELYGPDPDTDYYHRRPSCDTGPTTTPRPRPTDCADLVDIMFVVDGSGSIGPTDFDNIRKFLQLIANEFEIGPQKTQIGLVQFTEKTETEFHLNSYQSRQQVVAAIDRMAWQNGHTLIGRALTYTQQRELTYPHGDRASVPNIIIVLTDGMSQDDPRLPADVLRRSGVTIYAVGVTEAVHDQQLLAIAGSTSRVYKVRAFDRLDTRLRDAIVDNICSGTAGGLNARSLAEGVWIGLSARSKRGVRSNYDWADASRVDYDNWRFGQPHDGGGGACAVSEFEPLQRWSSIECNDPHAFICQKEPRLTRRNRRLLSRYSVALSKDSQDFRAIRFLEQQRRALRRDRQVDRSSGERESVEDRRENDAIDRFLAAVIAHTRQRVSKRRKNGQRPRVVLRDDIGDDGGVDRRAIAGLGHKRQLMVTVRRPTIPTFHKTAAYINHLAVNQSNEFY